ncbi:hypothetical protein P154DRAFT_464333 [Amniculicola lignicola CBS 123094]|uniref:Condensin complex subunit 1 n=1 Tax=Amniculicola lignicola CBS 123094 TaxID=1392246 RepID=A0A6A5WKF9_9PLEO|nr:hypothetical protein P154DRAFT_464333 [Amniculicola lignicola CBS 123094]
MDDCIVFDVNKTLTEYAVDPSQIATPEAPSALVDCEGDPDSLTPALINSELNPVVDAVAESPDAITRSSNFDTIQFLLKNSAQIPLATLSKILDLVVSALSAEVDIAHADLEADEQDTIQHHKQLLEVLAFLLRWALEAIETASLQRPAIAPVKGRGKGAKAKAGTARDGDWDATAQLQVALSVIVKTFKLRLARIFVTSTEQNTFISMLTDPIYTLLDNEVRMKEKIFRMNCWRPLNIAVKHHGHGSAAQTHVVQKVCYYEHLAEPMAECLQILDNEYDHRQLTESVLEELSKKQFDSNDPKGPKFVSNFLARISALLPHVVIKQMTLLQSFLESESYTLRCALIEVVGYLIEDLSKKPEDERSETRKAQILDFYYVLERRFLDLNPYCRSKVMQVYVKLCDLENFPSKKRMFAAALAAESLEDKSSNVRRNAISLLEKLVRTHPYPYFKGMLKREEWTEQLELCEAQINELKPPAELQERTASDEPTVDQSLLEDATQADHASPEKPKHPSEMSEAEQAAAIQKQQEDIQNATKVKMLENFKKVYRDGLKFIGIIEDSAEVVKTLLSSKNKSEVQQAMEFFKIIHTYRISNAVSGIKRMLRLIWTKGNSDEGKGVQERLITCYETLFFTPPPDRTQEEATSFVVLNMISLTYGTTPAELTSLEQLLSTMMKKGIVAQRVIQKLWQVYGYQKKATSKTQRRGAIMVLGMLALADPNIIVQEMETCLRIGLGELGRRDLAMARYTCIALRRISAPPGKQFTGAALTQIARLPNDHAILVRLAAMCDIASDSKEWFGVAEQAISAIYVLAKHPDVLCSEILRRKTKYVFSPHVQARPTSSGSDVEMRSPDAEDLVHGDEGDQPEQQPEQLPPAKEQNSALALSQLLFIVGHVAIKQIVHLELCELEFKRRKAEKEKKAPPRESSVMPANTPPVKRGRKKTPANDTTVATEADELDLMAGTTEDDFTEALAGIRERELLYGEHSLLTNFGAMVRDICSNNTSYNNSTLQAQAALCLAKLMCVSSDYCDANLDLLLTILARSKDPVVRSNLVVALGDMAVCFNHLIDDKINYLYERLKDRDPSVKRTCLMTLTFLILAGQVKVKGQLADMAKCIEDGDKKIADMARMFFTELSTKDNAVYNQFVDMFSVLSADRDLDEDAFRRIVKFIAGFIEKDKHAKQLSKKLADRLPRAQNERQWNDAAYALGLLQHKDEEIAKVVAEGYKVIQTT